MPAWFTCHSGTLQQCSALGELLTMTEIFRIICFMCSLAHVLLDNVECLGLSLPDKARSLIIWRDVGVEPLLPHIEKSKLRCFGQLIMMPPGFILLEVFQACPTGRRPHGRSGACCRDYIPLCPGTSWDPLGGPLRCCR